VNGTTVWQVKRLVGQVRVAPSQVPCCRIESGMVSQRLASSFAVVRMDPGLLAWRQRHAPSLQHTYTPGGQPAGATTTHLRQPRNVSGWSRSRSCSAMLHGEQLGEWLVLVAVVVVPGYLVRYEYHVRPRTRTDVTLCAGGRARRRRR
jgi:hypothetical protein